MNFLSHHQDTIVALATPHGAGAIGVIRLSGSHAINIADTIFLGKKLANLASHTLAFGKIVEKVDGRQILIDEVVASVYKNPTSYTGEDVVEIACHGSSYIIQKIIDLCLLQGARMADAGEFTQRAFMNGKLDLSQAEAVADLIASENKASHQIAFNQMRGGISNELQLLRDKLINFTALIELELDFSDEDVEFADRTQLYQLIQNLKSHLQHLIKSFEYGNAIKNGVPVAIIGKPNAGKSSLLNRLLNEERAIVSDIAGTTRDTIEEAININGIKFRFIDTAGLRHTEDVVEAIGVEKAKEKVLQAKVVLHLYEDDISLLDELKFILQDKIVFNIKTKIDQLNTENHKLDVAIEAQYPDYFHLGISAKTGQNIEVLIQQLSDLFKNDDSENAVIITNVRHKDALIKALDAVQQVENGMQQHLSGDLLAFHLRDALRFLGSITGQIEIDRDILGAIFSK
ncbi:MAG: tRNA uridine-5-carboxymethylaminomethyl(34) synthesis GTPase MnmE, partial [Bacteroidia bacterium]